MPWCLMERLAAIAELVVSLWTVLTIATDRLVGCDSTSSGEGPYPTLLPGLKSAILIVAGQAVSTDNASGTAALTCAWPKYTWGDTFEVGRSGIRRRAAVYPVP